MDGSPERGSSLAKRHWIQKHEAKNHFMTNHELQLKAVALRRVAMVLCLICLSSRLFADDGTNATTNDPWKELLAARERLDQLKPPSADNRKEFDRFVADSCEQAGKLADRFKDYQTRFPDSPNASKAWDNWMDLLNIAADGSPARRAELEKAEQQCLADPKLSRSQRSTIRYHQLGRLSDLAAMERFVRKVKDEMQEPTDFFCERMLEIAEFSQYPHAREIVNEVLKLTEAIPTAEDYRASGRASTNEPEWFQSGWINNEKQTRDRFREKALKVKKQLDRVGQPLPLQFTALDGTKIDLEQYRGKVVLLDFWATWCPPCVGGLPKVKALWNKLHKDGFEVIGMSYDQEREKLEKFLKRNALPWPQFFDPAGSDAPLFQSLGQPGPPAYWLIDREGRISDLNANDDLEKKVKQLLEAKEAKSTP